MNRFRLHWIGLGVALLATVGGASARAGRVLAEAPTPTPTPGGFGTAPVVTLRALRLAQGRYRGRAVQVIATVAGRISAGAKTTYLVRDGSVSEYVEADKPLPEMVTGRRVRILVRVPQAPSAFSRMRLVRATPAPAVRPSAPAATTPAPARASKGTKKRVTMAAAAAAQSEAANLSAKKPVTLTPSTRPDSRVAQLRPAYAATIRRFNKKLPQDYAEWIADLILRFGFQHQVDPRLVMAVVAAESNFKLTATSPKGAMGLGQLMPGTAASLGVRNAYDPRQNLAAAVRIIRANLDRYRNYGDKQFAMALAAYNAGKGAVAKYGGVPPYRETVNYIWKVYRIYRALAPELFR